MQVATAQKWGRVLETPLKSAYAACGGVTTGMNLKLATTMTRCVRARVCFKY
jgi:hypothetical protein